VDSAKKLHFVPSFCRNDDIQYNVSLSLELQTCKGINKGNVRASVLIRDMVASHSEHGYESKKMQKHSFCTPSTNHPQIQV